MADGGTVAIIAAEVLLAELARALRDSIPYETLDVTDRDQPIVLLSPSLAKGLEFDHVVLVEPAAITRQGANRRAYCELYVAMTRPTRTLTYAYSEPLPWPLKAA